MVTQKIQADRPGWKFWLLWMLATVIGGAVGILLGVPFDELLVALLGRTGSGPWTLTEQFYIILLKGIEGGMLGLGVGVGQWLLLRKQLDHITAWIPATALAMFLQGAFRWSLPSGLTSSQVLLTISLSFGIFLGMAQWFVLREHVPHALWWIAFNIAGWMLSMTSDAAGELWNWGFMSMLGIAAMAVALLIPFAVTGAGMVWLLRQSPAPRLTTELRVH